MKIEIQRSLVSNSDEKVVVNIELGEFGQKLGKLIDLLAIVIEKDLKKHGKF